MDRAQLYFFSQHIKEAENQKRKLTNTEKALLVGGGASLLGLGAIGRSIYKSSKDTTDTIRKANKSLAAGEQVLQESASNAKRGEDMDKIVNSALERPMEKNVFSADSSGFEATQDSIDNANKKVKKAEDTLNKIKDRQKARQSAASPSYGSDEYVAQQKKLMREDMYDMMKLRDEAKLSSDGIKYEKYQKEVRRLATALGEDPDVWSVS